MPYNYSENEEELYPLNQTAAPAQPPAQENILGRGAPALAPVPAPAPAQVEDDQSLLAPALYQPSAAPPPARQAQPLQPEPEYENILGRHDRPEKVESGFLADAASAAGRGIGRAIESTGAGLEVLGADVTGKFYKEKGRELAESDLLRPDDSERAGKDGTVKRTFLSALESLPSSLVPFVTGGLGAAIGSLAGPGGALYGGYAGGAAGLGVTFGAGTYGLEKERYLKEKAESGLPTGQLEADAHDFALSQSLWETIPEAASDIFMAGTFGVSKLLMSGLGATGATATLKGLLAQGPKEFAKQFGKAYLKSMPVEALSEMVTYWGQATGDKDAGLGDGPIAQGFIDAAATAAWLTLGMGGGMSAYSQRAKNRIAKAIQSDNPIMRGRAADRIQEGLVKEYGAERAQEWRDSAEKAFASGQGINMASPLFNAAQEADVQEEVKVKPEGVMTRALSSVGESVEVSNETLTPEQIKKMEQENTIAGKMAAGIPLTEEEEYSRYSPDIPPVAPVASAAIIAPEAVTDIASPQSADKLEKEVSRALPIMMRDLASAEAGRRLQAPDPNEALYSADAGATIRQPSSFPAWVTRDKAISKAGKKNIEKVVAKAIAGKEEELTPRQAELWEKIKSAAKEEYNTNPELLSGQAADKLSAEGFELGATEDISVGSLNPGDEVVITDSSGVPDKLTHKGFDTDGNAILKDGVTMTVDPFEQISIIGKKIGPEGDAASQLMVDFVSNVNSETSPTVIRRLIKDSPGMLARDKALAPYADTIKGSLERRLAELEPDKGKAAEEKKREALAKVAKKDKLSERAKKRKKEKESSQVKENSKEKDIRPDRLTSRRPEAKQKINVTSAGEKANSTARIVGEWLSVFESQAKRLVDIKVLTRREAAAGLSDVNIIPERLKRTIDNDKGILSGESAAALKWSDKSGKYVIISGDVGSASRNFSSEWALMELTNVAHEVGHVIAEEFLAGASNETRAAIFQAYRSWHKENKGDILSGKLMNEKRFPAGALNSLRPTGERFDVTAEVRGIPLPEYLLSFDEWFANETAKALTSSTKPINAVEKFFADLADVMRKLAAKIVGTDFVPDAAVANFVLGGDMLIDDKVAAAEGNKPADTDSIDLLYISAEPMTPRVKAMLDEAKAGPSEEKYVRRFEGKSNETSARYAARQTKAMIRDAGNTVDKFLGAISSRLRKWSPETEKALRRMEIGILQDTRDYTAAVEPLMKSAKEKMTPRDYSDWGLARHDSDKKKMDHLVGKYNLESEYKATRKVIERMGQLLTDAGFDIGNIEEYWPRIVKDTPGLLRHMEREDMRPVFSDALRAKAKQMGIKVAALTDEDRAKVASSVILGRSYGMSGPGSSKERVFESIPEELVQYYFDPDAAMIAHIRSVVETAAYRKFFGRTGEKMAVVRRRLEKVEKKLAGKNISTGDRIELENVATELRQTLAENEQGDFTQPIGMLVAELEAQGLDSEGQKEIRDTLMARFHERGATGAIRAYKNLSLIDTMGSYASALTQVGDFASPMYNAGLFETGRALGKAITGKQRISAKEAGFDDIAEEFTDSGKIGAAVNKIFKLTGLSKMNLVARDTFLNSAFEQFKKEAITDSAKLKAKIKPLFLNETDSVVQDLLNDDVTDNVRLLVFDRLLDFQPITKSEMPEKYLTAGNGRLFYSLKSYQIKQFDIYRREIVTGLKSDSKQERVQALKNMARLGMFLVLANATADELKDFLLGRESTLSDRVVDNILRLGGISRFVTWQARREGVGSAAAKQILPPFKLLDALTRDIYSFGDDKGFKSLGSVPLVGKLAYWRLGQGAEEKHDIWEIRYEKEKRRIKKFNDRLEKAKSKKEFISENREDFILSRRIKKFQSRLNRNRKLINKLESLEPSKKIHSRIDMLKDNRSEMTEKFLGKI
jgi:hypothetical protein